MADGGPRFRMRLLLQSFGEFERVDIEVFPPGNFITGLMQLPVVAPAKRDGEFIAHFCAQRSGLREAQVMRIRGLPATDQTRLRGDKFQVGFIAQSLRFRDGQLALVDLIWK